MSNDVTLTVQFRRNDGHRERVLLRDCSLAEAASKIKRVFHISYGLYSKADIYRGDELIETVANPDVRVESIWSNSPLVRRM